MAHSNKPRISCKLFTLALGLSLVLAYPTRRVGAHGLHGHVHVTAWAIENLPAGDLKELFSDPDVFQAALAGAMFPDTGYATDAPGARDYGEAAHWEPLIEPFIQYLRGTYGPSYDTKQERMLVAFLLGCAAHGLQDELFDSTFLFEAEERDRAGQDVTDPATDGFLFLDGMIRLFPGNFLPIADLLPLYAGDARITESLIANQVRIVRDGYVNAGIGARIATANGRRYRQYIPWVSANYLNMSVPGSLAAEVEPTMKHMQAIWERLHDRFTEANLVVHTWPDAPRHLRSADHTQVASWITLVLGKGIREGTATAALLDAEGAPVPFQLSYTRWGGTSRLVRLRPSVDLTPGAAYTAVLEAGALLVDGSRTKQRQEQRIRVACVADTSDCAPIGADDDPILRGAAATATPTSTASPSPTQTGAPSSSPSPSPTHSLRPVASSTPTPSWTATLTPTSTAIPSATASLTSTVPRSPTFTSTTVPTPTQTATQEGDGGACRIQDAPTPSSVASLALAIAAGALLIRRFRAGSGRPKVVELASVPARYRSDSSST